MSGMSLKQRLDAGDFVFAPGVYDGLSALAADRQGFNALYLSGYATSASLLGKPDAGYLTATHMSDRVRTICGVTETPVIADADTGFGGTINVEDTVRAYEAAGAAAIQIEDQVFPKRCGHTKNREVIDLTEAVAKIKVAVEARTSTDILIIARTDARTGHGLDEALRRGEAFLGAGADILFIESPETEKELEVIGQTFAGSRLLINLVEGGRTPILPFQTLQEMGYSVGIAPLIGLAVAAAALTTTYANVSHAQSELPSGMAFSDLNSLLGFERVWQFDERFSKKP